MVAEEVEVEMVLGQGARDGGGGEAEVTATDDEPPSVNEPSPLLHRIPRQHCHTVRTCGAAGSTASDFNQS